MFIKQLNIINSDGEEGKSCGHLSSVLSFLNKCECAMGKRLFKTQLLNPTFCEEWLEHEYDMIDKMRTKEDEWIMEMRKMIGKIKDIEKICRQMVLQKVYPSSIYHLYQSIEIIRQISLHNTDYNHDNIPDQCSRIMDFISHYLQIEKCKGLNSVHQYEENIICPDISQKLDELIEQNHHNECFFNMIREHFNEILNQSENTKEIEYVKEHITEKSGKSLIITKKRGTQLKNLLQKMDNSKDSILDIKKFSTRVDLKNISIKDIRIVGHTTSNDEISFPQLDKITKELLQFKEKINKEIQKIYNEFIGLMENQWLEEIENLAQYISKLDVLFCKVYLSKKYNYCRPVLDKNATKSFVDAKNLRHLLIEHINTSELFVPNDCRIGNDGTDGILLLGINMAGKSSYIKSIGISLIMAQSGCFVPASDFHYKPYQSIFSRIVSNDNLFKNLSLFAVEMTELRTILNNSNSNSLVLLDELSNGSETQSSVSILMATLIHLSRNQTSFICSTHFHEVLTMDELKELKNIAIKHLYVYYDRELDALVYDRKLKYGSGPSSYGLEVCKSLYFPVEFLDRAIEIRNKYHPENKSILSNQVSSYNAKKIRGMCEMCGISIGEDIHHLQEQKTANEKGIIDHFHKNHPANLINICEKCHLKEHNNDSLLIKKKEKRKTSKGIKIIYTDEDNCKLMK